MWSSNYFKIQKNGLSPFQTMIAYLGGSAFQTVVDNPVTAYRQLVQQYAKNTQGETVDPRVARMEASRTFARYPVSVSMSGLGPRLVGVGFKRVPKFGFLLGISYFKGEEDVGLLAATGASIASAPFINPVRMIEKQQRAYYRQTGHQKPVLEILLEAAAHNYKPLFRGTMPLMGHSLASATTGLVGQPQLQRYIQRELGSHTSLSSFTTGLVASACVSPIYIAMTNPLSRLEVIMQTSRLDKKSVSLQQALRELANDSRTFGLRGLFRGQGIGMVKAIISLTMFHEGRLALTRHFKARNQQQGHIYQAAT